MGSFKKAFAEAKDGSTFSWNGKSYKKEYAGSSKPAAKKFAPKPAAKKSASKPAAKAAPKPDAKTDEPSGFGHYLDEAKQLPGRAVEKGMRLVGVPAHARIFAGTLLGNRQKITEADFDKDELEQLRHAAKRATSRKRKGDIQYTDYDVPLRRGSLSRDQAAIQTIGRTGKSKTTCKGEECRVTDTMDYSNEDRDNELKRYEGMGKVEKAANVAAETLTDFKRRGFLEGAKRVPSRIANAYIGRDGREVDVKIARGGPIPPRHPNMPDKYMDSDKSRAELEREIKQRYRNSPDPSKDKYLKNLAGLHNDLFRPENYAKGGEIGGKKPGMLNLRLSPTDKFRPQKTPLNMSTPQSTKPQKMNYARGGGIEVKGKTKGKFV